MKRLKRAYIILCLSKNKSRDNGKDRLEKEILIVEKCMNLLKEKTKML